MSYGIEGLKSISRLKGGNETRRGEDRAHGQTWCSSDVVISCCCPFNEGYLTGQETGAHSNQQTECWFASARTNQSLTKLLLYRTEGNGSEIWRCRKKQRSWPKPSSLLTPNPPPPHARLCASFVSLLSSFTLSAFLYHSSSLSSLFPQRLSFMGNVFITGR